MSAKRSTLSERSSGNRRILRKTLRHEALSLRSLLALPLARLADNRATECQAAGWRLAMQKHTYLNRTATLAIAATVAFSSTPLLAQDAPVAEAPVEAVTTAEPAAVEPVLTDPHAGHTAQPAPVASAPAPKARAKSRAGAPVAKAAPAPAEIAAPATPLNPLQAQPMTPPFSEPIAEPTAATVEPAPAMANDDLERAAFVGILALLALGGAATAVSRRRRAPTAPDRPIVHETARSSPPQARPSSSAFAWGRTPAVAAPAAHAGGSWVERARCGPTPDNPSLSLKKRMKRAAFYEQRDRAVAAGRAKPLVPQAGLPQRATENFRQGWTPQPAYTHALHPA